MCLPTTPWPIAHLSPTPDSVTPYFPGQLLPQRRDGSLDGERRHECASRCSSPPPPCRKDSRKPASISVTIFGCTASRVSSYYRAGFGSNQHRIAHWMAPHSVESVGHSSDDGGIEFTYGETGDALHSARKQRSSLSQMVMVQSPMSEAGCPGL
ncbi:hypothetical protein VUR80DRAFT_1391 [Thermomyces stellatus]